MTSDLFLSIMTSLSLSPSLAFFLSFRSLKQLFIEGFALPVTVQAGGIQKQGHCPVAANNLG